MLKPTISKDTPSAISLLVSAVGATLSGSRCGQTIDLFGQGAAPAKTTALQAKRPANVESSTYGRIGQGSSQSVALQKYLENRLMMQLPRDGLTKCFLIWRRKRTPALRHYCQLFALRRTMKETGYFSMPTPNATASKGGRLKPRVVLGGAKPGINFQDFCSLTLGQRYPIPSYGLSVMGYPMIWDTLRPMSALAMPSSLKSQRNL